MAATVLIVDDDPTLVHMLEFVLARGGFVTRSAFDGGQAIQILASEAVDVVVLDVMLPDLDGYEICRRMRRLPKASHVPILMLTARTQVDDRLTGFEAGADDYVLKPADPKEIIARIHALLARTQRQKERPVLFVAFVGVKGGVGASTVALNVALLLAGGALAPGTQPRVLLAECSPNGQSGLWLLGLNPGVSLTDLVSQPGYHASLPTIQRAIHKHPSGLDYLPVTSNALGSARLPHGALASALALLRSVYDAVVLDVSAGSLVENSDLAADLTALVPVAEHDELSLWHLQAVLAWVRAQTLERVVPGFVLVDRSPVATKMAASQVATRSGLGILAVIPPEATVLYHGNARQEPLAVAAPDSPAALALADLVRRLGTAPIEAPIELRP